MVQGKFSPTVTGFCDPALPTAAGFRVASHKADGSGPAQNNPMLPKHGRC
jgi:hypothetical protein